MKMTLNEEIEYLQSGNWYDKVRAVLPTDEYLKLGWAIGDILGTLELFRSLVPEPQTNAARIRAMSDEELAKWLCSLMTAECCDQRCPARDICNLGDNGLAKWMKQPAEED